MQARPETALASEGSYCLNVSANGICHHYIKQGFILYNHDGEALRNKLRSKLWLMFIG